MSYFLLFFEPMFFTGKADPGIFFHTLKREAGDRCLTHNRGNPTENSQNEYIFSINKVQFLIVLIFSLHLASMRFTALHSSMEL